MITHPHIGETLRNGELPDLKCYKILLSPRSASSIRMENHFPTYFVLLPVLYGFYTKQLHKLLLCKIDMKYQKVCIR